MADKIEYSRMLVKRTAQTGEVPTVPPITATTLNQMIPTDLFVGEFFLNEVDDLLWIRTDNGILPISLSGSTGGTGTQTLTQVLFEGNATNGYDIEVSAGDTIIFSGLSSGATTQFLGIDSSGKTIVSTVSPGTPDLEDVLSIGNTTGANDISVNIGYKVEGQSASNWIRPETADGYLELNTGSELTIVGITSGNTGVVLTYDPDTKFVRYSAVSGTTGTSGTSGTSGSNGTAGTNGTSGTSGVSGDALWTSGTSVGSVVGVVGSNTNTAEYALIVGKNNTAAESQTGFTAGNIIIGSGNTFNGVIGQVFGYQNSNLGLRNFIAGTQHYIDSADSAILGGGSNTINNPLQSFIGGGYGNQILGTVADEDNAIIGGNSNVLNSVERSVIIGGSGITGSSDNMVYVPNITIVSATTGTSTSFIGIDANNQLIKVSGGVSGTSGTSGSNGSDGSAGIAGTSGTSGTSPAGSSLFQSGTGLNSVVSIYYPSSGNTGINSLLLGGTGNTITSTVNNQAVIGGRNCYISSSNSSNGIFASDTSYISSNSYASSIVASENSYITSGYYSFIQGRNNVINGSAAYPAAVVGTHNSTITNTAASIFGGYAHTITNGPSDGVIIGGRGNSLAGGSDPGNYIFGGTSNSINNSPGSANAILGGESNNIRSSAARTNIVGGISNTISSSNRYNVIIGSQSSTVTGTTSGATMIGTVSRSADRDNCVFVENLKLFNYANLNYANDSDAAAGGVVLGQIYHTSGTLKIRIT